MPTRRVELIKHPLRVRTLEVRGVKRPGPRYGLLTLRGEALADFESPSPTDHVGLVPPDDEGTLTLPEVTDGRLRWPQGARRTTRSSKLMPDGFANYLLVGDLTAVPAVARWLAVLPEGAMAQVLIAARSEEDVVEFRCPQPAWVLWLTGLSVPEADHLPPALGQLKLYSRDTFAWAAGEAVAMREVRRVLLEEHGLPSENVQVTGYWRRDQPDYDYEAPLPTDRSIR